METDHLDAITEPIDEGILDHDAIAALSQATFLTDESSLLCITEENTQESSELTIPTLFEFTVVFQPTVEDEDLFTNDLMSDFIVQRVSFCVCLVNC